MTRNRLLDYLLSFDSDTSICELLELIRKDKQMVIDLCKESNPSVDYSDKDLVFRVAKICTILEFKIGKYGSKYREFYANPNGDGILPGWIYDKRFYYEIAIYVGKHLDDFTKAKMFISAPQPFLNRNIYFNKDGLERF